MQHGNNHDGELQVALFQVKTALSSFVEMNLRDSINPFPCIFIGIW